VAKKTFRGLLNYKKIKNELLKHMPCALSGKTLIFIYSN